jgi:hypothetical protein
VTVGRREPGSGDGREDGAVSGHGGDGWAAWTQAAVMARRTTWFPSAVVTTERMARFPGAAAMAMAVEAVGEADEEVTVWYRQQRRSGTVRFLGTTMVWRRCALSGVEEDAGNFGRLTSSKPKSSGYHLRTGQLGVL